MSVPNQFTGSNRVANVVIGSTGCDTRSVDGTANRSQMFEFHYQTEMNSVSFPAGISSLSSSTATAAAAAAAGAPSSSCAQGAIMSIFRRYTDMQQTIDQYRSKRQKVQERIDAMCEETKKIQQKRAQEEEWISSNRQDDRNDHDGNPEPEHPMPSSVKTERKTRSNRLSNWSITGTSNCNVSNEAHFLDGSNTTRNIEMREYNTNEALLSNYNATKKELEGWKRYKRHSYEVALKESIHFGKVCVQLRRASKNLDTSSSSTSSLTTSTVARMIAYKATSRSLQVLLQQPDCKINDTSAAIFPNCDSLRTDGENELNLYSNFQRNLYNTASTSQSDSDTSTTQIEDIILSDSVNDDERFVKFEKWIAVQKEKKKTEDDDRMKKASTYDYHSDDDHDDDDDILKDGKRTFQEYLENYFEKIKENKNQRMLLLDMEETQVKPIQRKLEECRKRYNSLQVQHDRIAKDNITIEGQLQAILGLKPQPVQVVNQSISSASLQLPSKSDAIMACNKIETDTSFHQNQNATNTTAMNDKATGVFPPINPYARTKPKRSPGLTNGRNMNTIKNTKKRKSFFNGLNNSDQTSDVCNNKHNFIETKHQNVTLENNSNGKIVTDFAKFRYVAVGTEALILPNPVQEKIMISSKYFSDSNVLPPSSAISGTNSPESEQTTRVVTITNTIDGNQLEDLNKENSQLRVSVEGSCTPTMTHRGRPVGPTHRFNYRDRQFGCSVVGISSTTLPTENTEN